MAIYKAAITIHDGEHEYVEHRFVSQVSTKRVVQTIIKEFGFNQKKHFKVYETTTDGDPVAWEEVKPGYRIYEFGEDCVSPARISVIGLQSDLGLNELMNRPVLPLFSKDATWIWGISNQIEYWWYHGDYVLVAMFYPTRLSKDDSCFSLTSFPYWDLKKHCDSMVENKWFLLKGDIDG